jgi:hypothetical protein
MGASPRSATDTTAMEAGEALEVARRATPRTEVRPDPDDPMQRRPGDRVRSPPTTMGATPVVGEIVALSADEIAIRHESPHAGTVVVHCVSDSRSCPPDRVIALTIVPSATYASTTMDARPGLVRIAIVVGCLSAVEPASARPPRDWPGYGRDPQHSAVATVAGRRPLHVRWSTPVDLAPQYWGTSLLVHYGSPLATRRNTLIVTVKTGATDGFRVEGRRGDTGALVWTERPTIHARRTRCRERRSCSRAGA